MHQFRDILTFLQNLFQCKVIFIPGNHDPLAFLNTE
jgi:metallophosphoesterase superfamily enzyme